MRIGISAIAGVGGDGAAVHGADGGLGPRYEVNPSTQTFPGSTRLGRFLSPLPQFLLFLTEISPGAAREERQVEWERGDLTLSTACSPLPP